MNPSGQSTSQAAPVSLRRASRACDLCRRKKRRCNSKPGTTCLTCIETGSQCTFNASSKRSEQKQYVSDLQDRVAKMESLLVKLHPNTNFSRELGPPISAKYRDPTTVGKSPSVDDSTIPGDEDDSSSEEEYEEPVMPLSDRLHSMRLDPLAHFPVLLSPEQSIEQAFSGVQVAGLQTPDLRDHAGHRPYFWARPAWELKADALPAQRFDLPPDDLSLHLIDRYFELSYVSEPILHRPTFEQAVSEGLHYTDESFAAVYMLVCANGARGCGDSRAYLSGGPSQSAGWKWYNQVRVIRESQLMLPPTLHQMQRYALAARFLLGSSLPRTAWTVIGLGIRAAIDAGVHLKRNFKAKPTADDEQWKRVFWSLVLMDVISCTMLGRPRAIRDDELDAGYPAECDDEYWTHSDPEKAFKQPVGSPSCMSYWRHLLDLFRVRGLPPANVIASSTAKKRQMDETIRRLDDWYRGLPQHMQWDPAREDNRLFAQSACLSASFRYVQLSLHRGFFFSRADRSINLAHLAVCVAAAHAGIKVVQALHSRLPTCYTMHKAMCFAFGSILVINMWASQHSGMRLDFDAEMQDVQTCLDLLAACESHLLLAGRARDRLGALISACQVKNAHNSLSEPITASKRPLDAVVDVTATPYAGVNPLDQGHSWYLGEGSALSMAESIFTSEGSADDFSSWITEASAAWWNPCQQPAGTSSATETLGLSDSAWPHTIGMNTSVHATDSHPSNHDVASWMLTSPPALTGETPLVEKHTARMSSSGHVHAGVNTAETWNGVTFDLGFFDVPHV